MTQFDHKKSLGQNFLINPSIVTQIVDVTSLTSTDTIVEIGPGEGVLTDALAHIAGRVIAIELDERLIPVLRERFVQHENVDIIHGDILRMDMTECAQKHHFDHYTVVANIPYYITAPIMRFFLENIHKPDEMYLMVQKEVAQRITAAPGEMSILSVAAQYYADVDELFIVPRTDFDPQPDVDSAFVRFRIHKTAHPDVQSFFRIVKIGFSARRKTLCNNLVNGLHRERSDIQNILSAAGLSVRIRAQELSVADWGVLHTALMEKKES